MTARTRLHCAVVVLAVACAAGAAVPAAAQLPVESLSLDVSDARLEDLSVSGLTGAGATARQAGDEPVWVAYQVAAVERRGSLCCGQVSCCDVERSHDGLTIDSTLDDGPMFVLLRFLDGHIDRIRPVSETCSVGFGGRRVLWAGPVATRDSLEQLAEWIGTERRKVSHGALAAIAYHDDGRATGILESLANDEASEKLAEDAIFWLGTARGADGFAALERILDQDLPIGRHKAAVFGLAQSPVDTAVDELTRLGRHDHRDVIRREALFWLGQMHAASAAETIYRAALEDSSLEVAEHAVFVLSLLPDPHGVELLARLLTQRERPEVRKQALFWIGQSDSDEALEIVARILNE